MPSINIAACLVFLIISFNTLAQNKFLPGYTVSPTNDTIRCLIKFEDWKTSPGQIEKRALQSGSIEVISAKDISAFYLETEKELYLSKKIGVLDIDLSQEYKIAPSLETKDSTIVFLRLITSGPKASLLEYLNDQGASRYFLQTSMGLKELINYQFYRAQGSQKYLLQLDEYKLQLPKLLPDLKPDFSVPEYTEKSLKKFISDYNNEGHEDPAPSKGETKYGIEFDLAFAAGLENWEDIDFNLKNKATFGFGLRFNLPRKFHNRYLKLAYMTIPGVTQQDFQTSAVDEKVKLHSIEIGIGSYIGRGDFRPNLGLDYISPIDTWRHLSIGPHIGVSYKRMVTLELSHFFNFYSLFSSEEMKVNFVNQPRISLTYYQNLNKLFIKK